ncbi:DUF4430 domain-containing protein [Paenibacillus lupini]|uniref:DUF4430 domain-containing protein n=1 Tax=Paenibacillus lupini TaxID=1450204 RepID=UPI00141FF446|nr:DUF4430 domain-containing protein [Paenibacillus lupini]NIK21344.1 hypothetical protein [Paenibacillus lupini]
MTKKKWLSAWLIIIGVLAVAYFWGGDYAKNPSSDSTGVIVSKEEPLPTSTPIESADPELDSKGTPSAIETSEATATLNEQQNGNKEEPANTKQDSHTGKDPVKSNDETKASASPSSTNTPADSGSGAVKEPDPTSTAKPPAASPDENKDKYQTDPVPLGKPKPVEPQDTIIDKKKALTVTLSVSTATILNNLNSFNKDKLEVLPKDGVIYKAQKVTLYEGESVFDVLLREMKKNKIHMEFEMTPIYNSNYIEGINNIYEFDCGELSGWMYKVNGWFPNYGASRYALKDGDVVEWVYTCDLGRDVGGYVAGAGGNS